MGRLKLLVIVPLVEERNYLYDALKGRPGWTVPMTPRDDMIYRFDDDGRRADVRVRTMPKMGPLEAVLALNAGVNSHSPQLVILVGLAGAMNPEEVGLGDVVVSNQVKTYSGNKIGTISSDPAATPFYKFASFPPAKLTAGQVLIDERDRRQTYSYVRYDRAYVECGAVHAALSSVENAVANSRLAELDLDMVPEKFASLRSCNRKRNVHFGWLFGSSHVIDSREYREYLIEKDGDRQFDVHSQTNEHERIQWKDGPLMAVDMESYGVLKAIETLRMLTSTEGGSKVLMGGIVVRGISDLGEGKVETDRHSDNELRRIAVKNAAQVTAELIEQLDYRLVTGRR